MPDTLLPRVAELTGLPYYQTQSPFISPLLGNGAVIGAQDGFLVTVGYAISQGSYGVDILIDTPKINNSAALKSRLQTDEALKQALGTHSSAQRVRERVQVDAHTVRWHWSYLTRKPDAAAVSALVTAGLRIVSESALRYDGKCPVCHKNPVSEIVLANGIPTYLCADCQEKQRQSVDGAALAYDAAQPNARRGILYGLGAMLVGALAWSGVAFLLDRVFALAALGVGAIVALGVLRGMGKLTWLGRALILVLTLVSILLGDFIYFILVSAFQLGTPFDVELFRSLVSNFWVIEDQVTILASLFFALLGALYIIWSNRRPATRLTFEPLV